MNDSEYRSKQRNQLQSYFIMGTEVNTSKYLQEFNKSEAKFKSVLISSRVLCFNQWFWRHSIIRNAITSSQSFLP